MTFSNPAADAKAHAADYVQSLLAVLGDRDPLAVQEELPAAVARLADGLSDAELRRPERPGKWSVIEVVQHLADTELVYGFRLRMIVAHDRPAIQGYDQDLWAGRLRYRDARLEEALEQLGVLRRMNLRFLRSLHGAELERVGLHEERGPESVRRCMQMIAAHDLVHRAQIERIRAALGRAAPRG